MSFRSRKQFPVLPDIFPNFALVALATVVLAGLPVNLANAQASIRIGGSLPLTGRYAELGKAHERGYRVCLKQANDRGGLLGRQIKFKAENDHSHAADAACEILLNSNKQVGSLDHDKMRDAISKFNENTAFGAYRVDENGVQVVAHKMILFQWQDGKKAIVWPEELAVDKPRFPTPAWKQRK